MRKPTGANSARQLDAVNAQLADTKRQLAAAQAMPVTTTVPASIPSTTRTTTAVTPTTMQAGGPTTTTYDVLSDPKTLRNPDPTVGGLACYMQNFMWTKGPPNCVWNGLVWMPTG